MKRASARALSWTVLLVVGCVLAGVGVFLGTHIDSAIEAATQIARPHEVQTQLEHVKATIDALQDSVQDYLIDGADGMRFQYEDAVRALGAETSELSATREKGLSASQLSEVDEAISKVLATTRTVIDARRNAGEEAARRVMDPGLAAIRAAQRNLDALVASQQEMLKTRERTLRWDVTQMFGGLVATITISLGVLIGAILLVEFDRRRTAAMEHELRLEKDRLQGEVQQQAAALTQAGRELTWFSRRALQIQEQERRSVALELHDQIGQELATLVHTLNRCERELPPDGSQELKTAVQDSVEVARAVYGDVHNLALDLRPAMLDRFGLIPTLQWFARQQAKHSGCEITVEADAFPSQLPSDVLISAFRIVQEAVVNAIRHAKPRRIEITAAYRPGRIELTIRDDGTGFDPQAVSAENEPRVGLGIIGMRQRALDAGGQVTIQSTPGSGTLVTALLTIAEPA